MFFDPADYLEADPAQAESEREAERLRREAEQRAKLCEATTRLAAKGGLEAATIQLAARSAGVGQGTYYKLYDSREACLREAFERCAATTLDRVEAAAARSGGDSAGRLEAGLRELLALLDANPAVGRLLLVEIHAGDDHCREAQQRWLERFAGLLVCKRGDNGLPQRGSAAWMAAATLKSMLALRLEDDAPLQEALEDVVCIGSWPQHTAVVEGSAQTVEPADEAPGSVETAATTRGTRRLRRTRKAQRGRIVVAMVELAGTKGYKDAHIADIAKRAEVSKPVFYAHFSGKEECLLAAFSAVRDSILGHVGEAVNDTGPCAERAVVGLRALVESLAEDPRAARLVTTEVRAAGRRGEQRYEQAMLSFAQLTGGGETDEVALMTARAAAETIASEVSKGRTAELEDLLPQLVFTTLAPYLGGEKATEAARSAGANQARAR
ncbi:MAG TPA: helix-turn-helix domain-containing protein [Solirubrobacterales bacterium]|nr:helix-turn-helix domain-containing protein [Solirubrobacterales bacterium]